MSTKRYKRRKRNLKKLTLAILLFFIIFRGVPKVIGTASNAISAVLNNGSIETAKSHGNITSKELSEGIPLLIQWDKRWRDELRKFRYRNIRLCPNLSFHGNIRTYPQQTDNTI